MARGFDFQLTPQEIAEWKARFMPATYYQQGMGIGLNVAQNLNPSAGLGFVLGNIAGHRINNYMNERRAMKAQQLQADFDKRWSRYLAPNPASQSLPATPTAANLGLWAQQNLIPQALQQNNSPNPYDFSNFQNMPSQNWQPNNPQTVNNTLLNLPSNNASTQYDFSNVQNFPSVGWKPNNQQQDFLR